MKVINLGHNRPRGKANCFGEYPDIKLVSKRGSEHFLRHVHKVMWRSFSLDYDWLIWTLFERSICVASILNSSKLKRIEKKEFNESHVFFIRIFNRSLLSLTFSRIWKVYATEEESFSSWPYFFINIVNQMIHNPIEGYYIYGNRIMYTIVNSIYVNLICLHAWESLSRYYYFFW